MPEPGDAGLEAAAATLRAEAPLPAGRPVYAGVKGVKGTVKHPSPSMRPPAPGGADERTHEGASRALGGSASLRGMEPVLRPPRPVARWSVLLLAPLVLLACSSCGRRSGTTRELNFEQLTDTTGLTRGAPILLALEPYRITGRAVRVRGSVDLPDGTRMQVAIVQIPTGRVLITAQATVEKHDFETPPLMLRTGPLPEDLYRFEVSTQFNAAWQSPEVLHATRNGFALHGPGMTRDGVGQTGFFLSQERRL